MLRLKDIKKQLDLLQGDIGIVHRKIAEFESKSRALECSPYEKYYKVAIDRIGNQDKIIENLTNLMCNKYEHGLLVISNDGEMPMVIKDGKVITGNEVSSFSVDWSRDGCVVLSVDYSK